MILSQSRPLLSVRPPAASPNFRRLRLSPRFRSPSPEPPPTALSRPVMSSVASQETTSTASHRSHASTHEEDWDRSESDIQSDGDMRTPRNSVLFPADGPPDLSPRKGGGRGDRTLSELLKLYAQKGTDCQFSQEEATRIADVLGQWVRLFPFLSALRVLGEKLT